MFCRNGFTPGKNFFNPPEKIRQVRIIGLVFEQRQQCSVPKINLRGRRMVGLGGLEPPIISCRRAM
jgi:hypothetical protein